MYNTTNPLKFINSLLKQTRMPDEIVIIDNCSSNNLYETLKKLVGNLENVHIERLAKRRTIGAARNVCVERSTGDIIYFADDDVVMHPRCLENLLSRFTDEKIAGVSGNVWGLYRDTVVARVSHELYKDRPHYATWNIAYRKRVIEEVGFFKDIQNGSDMDIAYRIMKKGYRITYAPDALVYHVHPRSITEFIKKRYNYGKYTTPLLNKERALMKLMSGTNAIHVLKNPLHLFIYSLGVLAFLAGRLMGWKKCKLESAAGGIRTHDTRIFSPALSH